MANEVSPYESAVLVLGYLQGRGYAKTAACFKREAKEHFGGGAAAAPPPGVRDLLDLLNDYVRLKEGEARRQALAGRSSLAARLLQALDEEAGEQAAAVTAAARAAAAQRQVAAAAAAAELEWAAGQGAAAAPLLGPAFVGDAPLQSGLAPPPQQQQLLTPGRQRKSAPRKRRRGLDSLSPAGGWEAAVVGEAGCGGSGGAAQAAGEGAAWGSPIHLLDLPLDAEGLEALLDDGPLQLRFAENLAQHINENLGASQQQQQQQGGGGGGGEGAVRGGGGVGGASPSGGFVADLLADPQTLLAELPGDPRMAEVLQTVVRPGGTAAAGGAASPASGSRPRGRKGGAEASAAQEAAAAAVAAATAGGGRGRRQKLRPARCDSRAGSLQEQLAGGEPQQEQGQHVLYPEARPAVQPVVDVVEGSAPEAPGHEGQPPRQAQQPLPAQLQQQQPALQPPPVLLPQRAQRASGGQGHAGQVAGKEQQEPEAGAGEAPAPAATAVAGLQAMGEAGAQPAGAAAAAAGAAVEGPRPRSQQALLESALAPAGGRAAQASKPAAGKPVGGLPVALAAAACGEPRLLSAAVAAEALNAAAAGLGPLDLPASEDQLLQDVDDLF